MKDVVSSFEVDGVVYPLVFNLNVMESIQEEYGTLDVWGDLTDGEEYAKREFLEKNPNSALQWEELSKKEKNLYKGEPDAKAVIFGFTEMINEGIDIENDEHPDQKREFVTKKQVGRLITRYGLANATRKLNNTVTESTKSEIKNV